MISNHELKFSTNGKGTYDISGQIQDVIKKSGVSTGICQIFIQHTSASLVLCENIDPDVRENLETFMERLVPSKSDIYSHKSESPDYMPAHIRTTLSLSSLSIPVDEGKANLGLWQGIYLWEHRVDTQKRNIVVTIIGD